eukprot:scaffold10571_cov14-Tisochrysis_lutea.AAC.1
MRANAAYSVTAGTSYHTPVVMKQMALLRDPTRVTKKDRHLQQPLVYNELTPLKEDEKGEPSGGPHSKINWLKAGILSADKVLTVSPNYAAEIGRDDSSGVGPQQY